MRILLTGAAGFLGSNLADRLLADGHSVIGVDNFITGRRQNLGHLAAQPRFEILEHDVIEPLAIDDGLDWILHFASPASPPKYLAAGIETLRTNAEGTYQLLELARRTGAAFFLASTSEVYGDPAVHPQTEVYWGNVNPIGPRSVYDEGKRFAEAMTMAHHARYGTAVRIVRIFNTYGPRMDPHDGRVVTNFIRQALSGEPLTAFGRGEQTRSFQYVDDLVEGVVRLMRVPYQAPVNLGNPDEYTILELAQVILDLTGSTSQVAFEPLPQDDPRQRKPDISLAKHLLGWEPGVPMREGLQRTIDAMRESGW